MRRLVPIAAIVLFLAVPLWAQHGGGHGGGGFSGGHGGGGFSGGHAGFGGGHAGFSGGHAGGGQFSGGMHSSPGARGFTRGPSVSRGAFSQRARSNRPFLHDGFRGDRFRGDRFRHDRFRHRGFQTFGFRNNCFGFGCWNGYPWAYGGYYDPYWWWDTGSSYDEDYQQNLATAAEMNRQNLEEQRMMREEEADGDQDLYAQSAPAPRVANGDGPKSETVTPNTVLVFRDQRKQEISNYAIVGQTLWSFAPQHSQKIPLAELDLPATVQANEAQGVTFRVPGSSEAQ